LVLPGTWSAALALLIISAICFGLWPNVFKLAGTKWRFELFSFDFAAGAVLLALLAAFTLGTLGSSLDFSDSMLVAGRRAELIAFLAGGVFAFANILYLGTIALIGLSNATLLTFSVLGCALSLLRLQTGQYLTSVFAFVILVAAAALAIVSAKAKRAASASKTASVGSVAEASGRPAAARPQAYSSKYSHSGARSQAKPPLSAATKGAITGLLAGLTFCGVTPVMSMAQTVQLGIGAYGGLLMATLGMLVATFFLSFFFLNVSLEGGVVRYSTYFTGTAKSHITGALSGAIWATAALALYAAYTGTVTVSPFAGWLTPFSGALLAAISGLLFWQKLPQRPGATRNTLMALILFAVGVGVLLAGLK
jgi:glucose uptake protein